MPDSHERLRDALNDRYQVGGELGRGGMAVVYLADDLKHHRKVAIKVLRADLAESVGAERFTREIQTAAQLNHPNILSVIDSGQAGTALYYVTPFVEGRSLRDRLDAEKQLPIDEAIRITCEVADALGYAHAAGIVHRDIKPENILFQAGHAVVSDFGIATAVGGDGGQRLTQAGMAIGTPTYMSPEQATGEALIDARSDLYSLAAVLYEMLTGAPPHAGVSAQASIARKLVDPVPGIRVVRDAVAPGVEAAVLKALAKAPVDRFATVREFSAALTSDATLTAQLSATSAPTALIGVGGGSRRPLVVGVIAAAVIGIVALIVLERSGSRMPEVASVTPLTSAPGAEWFPSLSPDANWIVYSGQPGHRRQIFLQSIGSSNPIALTTDTTSDNDQPAFSPDGERIAFRSGRDGGGIFVMGRTGESVKRITRFGYRPAWAPDGRRLAYVSRNLELIPQNNDVQSTLWVVDVASGVMRQLDVPDAVQPAWSPHGYRIAYTQRLRYADILTVPADGGTPVAVTNDAATDWNPTWSPDGKFLYFVSDRGGSMNLWRVAIDERSGKPNGAPEAVTTPASSLAHISFSADGKKLAYSSAAGGVNIERGKFDPVAGTLVGEPQPITTGSRRWSSPDPSPDGQQVAFYDLDQSHIYVAKADGSDVRQVTSDSAMDRVPRWSPDGHWLAFYSNRNGRLLIWGVRPDGSELHALASREGSLPVWSPDGARLTSSGNDEGSQTFVVDVRDSAGKKPELLAKADSSVAPFTANSWSPDGTRLVGVSRFSDDGVYTYDLRSRVYERLTRSGGWPVWLPDGRRILYVQGGNEFLVVDRETKVAHKVFSVTRAVIGPPRLTSDGRTVYFTRRSTEADIWLMTFK